MKIDKTNTNLSFDVNHFKYSRILPNYIKRILKSEVSARSNDDVKIVAKFIQLENYSYEKQLLIIKHSLFEEYEPQRILIRQNTSQRSFYFVIQGICVATKKVESSDTLVEFLHTGDTFGYKEVLYKNKSKTTITTTGYQNVCLLSIDMNDFLSIFEPIDDASMKIEFLSKNVPELNAINYNFESLFQNTDNHQTDYNTVFYKKGTIVF